MVKRLSQNSKYTPCNPIGRFAPSPTGALHLGSLVAAIASYMIVKQSDGQWLVRIEDIDQPREVPGATKQILQTLEDFGLHWDGPVVYQSQRTKLYHRTFEELISNGFVYHCDCSRKTVELRNFGVYDQFCRELNKKRSGNIASRVKFDFEKLKFQDQILGDCCFDSEEDKQDFVVKRRDGLFAYQLAVVVDDIEQGITEVVRGADILGSTPRQKFLYACLNKTPPTYYHIPLVLDRSGKKESKRFKSPRIEKQHASKLLISAFEHLGQAVDEQMSYATPEELIEYFRLQWKTENIVTRLGLENKAWKK